MPGWVIATSSTSFGKTLKPETRIMSFLRSTILTYPPSFIMPMSPERKNPSSVMTLAVSSGRCQ
ncbi:hypothetical protein D3C72_2375860 [compost metagenome]